MNEYESDTQSGDGEQPELELVRDFLDSTFDSVERDGLMVSRGAGKIWVHEAHGISVPEGAPEWSKHHYELLWCAKVDVVFDELERRFGWSA